MIERLRSKDGFLKNFLTLLTGTAIAQIIPILISPVLTRLYTPNDFGIFGLYASIIVVTSLLSTGRYELAILIPPEDSKADNLLALSLTLSVLFCTVLFVFIFILNHAAPFFKLPAWAYIVPAGTLLAAIYQSLSYWLNRKKAFKQIATNRIIQGAGSAASQTGLGILSIGFLGQIFGQMLGQFMSIISLYIKYRILFIALLKSSSLISLMALAKEYVSFPKYLTFAGLAGAFAMQAPVFMISILFSPVSAGFYIFTQRILGTPITVISSSIGEVFKQEASDLLKTTGDCRPVFRRTLILLLKISAIPFLILFLFAPLIFNFVFGADWKDAGDYARILTPMFFMRFVANPLSNVLILTEKQSINLYLQISLLCLVAIAFYLGYLFSSITLSLIIFSFSYSITYAVMLVYSYKFSISKL